MFIPRTTIISGLLAIGLAATLTGCSTASGNAPASAQASGPLDKVLFDYPFTSLPVYAALTPQIQQKAKERGITVELTNDNSDLATQVSNLTTKVNSDVDAVVSFPMDPASLENIAAQYTAAGKIWVTYAGDMKAQTTSLKFSFHESGRLLGESAGQWASRTTGGRGKVLVIEDQLTQIGRERTDGILEGLKTAAPNMEIVAAQQGVTPEQGLSVTSAVLSSNPDLTMVLAATGDGAQGAYQALLSAGRSDSDARTYVGGLDGNLPLMKAMSQSKDSIARGLVTVKPEEIAPAIVEIVVEASEGRTAPMDLPVYLVTAETPDLSSFISSFGG
ncbi:sugar ABC transporter substrate-binding protein [Paenarthrobacter sp. YAF11_1]|uniref:sugar ABC transporter substrate-binding protein n=1 Tax=Paenarthrobacter sp. YAF11_1 TaxID=3233074 RepID=UPI003F9D58DC